MREAVIKEFYENLTEETSLELFEMLYHHEVYFKDPFNEVKGIRSVYQIFSHMYENLDSPHFKIVESIQNNDVIYVKWEFHFCFKDQNTEQMFEGVSRLVIDDSGKIIEHLDFWDAAEHIYEKIPLFGWLVRKIKGKLSQ